MAIQTFLCCFNTYEGSWICGIASLFLGALRVYLQWFILEFRHRMTEMARKELQIDFSTLQVITALQMSVATISMIVSLVMLVGLFKRWRLLLCPWMVWAVIEELFSIFVIIFFSVCGVMLKCSVYISDAVMLVIFVYFMLCVYSCFKQMRRQQLPTRSRAVGHLTLDYDEFEDDPESPLLPNRPV